MPQRQPTANGRNDVPFLPPLSVTRQCPQIQRSRRNTLSHNPVRGTRKPIRHELRTARMSRRIRRRRPRPLAERSRATPVSSVTKCHSLPYGIQPIDVESGHAMKGREVGERAVLGSIGSDCVRVFLGQPEPDELLCIRRVDIHEAVPLGEKRQNSFLLSRFQLRANVRHLCEHTLPAFLGPRSDESPFRPVTAAAPVQEHLFAVLGTVRLLRTGRDVD